MNRARNNRIYGNTSRKQAGGAFLAVLIIFVLLAGAAFVYLEQNSMLEAIAGQQAQAEAENERLADDLATMRDAIATLEAERTAANEQWGQLARQLTTLRTDFDQARLGISTDNAGSQTLPILTEAAGVFRLAHQYLVASGDLVTAINLYESGIDLLREVDDPAVDAIRLMMEDDLMRLRAVSRIDKENIYSRLTQLAERVVGLDLTPVAENEVASDTIAVENAEQHYLRRFLRRLNDYVVIQRIDDQVRPPTGAEESYRVELSIRAQLEQAKLALLRGNQNIYQRSIESTLAMLERYPFNYQDKQGLIQALESLRDTNISQELPMPGDGLTILQRLLSPETPGQTGARP